jgi:hypothetical protein
MIPKGPPATTSKAIPLEDFIVHLYAQEPSGKYGGGINTCVLFKRLADDISAATIPRMPWHRDPNLADDII